MLDETERKAAGPKMVVVTIIHAAMMLCVVGYFFILSFVRQSMEEKGQVQEPSPVFQTVVYVMAGLAVVVVAAGITIRRAALSPKRLALQGFTIDTLVNRYMTACIVSGALFEACAIFGFLLGIIGGGFGFFYPFAGVSLGLFILFWPTLGRIEDVIQEARSLARNS